jgi:hypothetical protein
VLVGSDERSEAVAAPQPVEDAVLQWLHDERTPGSEIEFKSYGDMIKVHVLKLLSTLTNM